MSKKIYVATLAGLIASSAALAADLPAVKGPPAPPPPPIFSWSGPYLGLSIGYGGANTGQLNGFALGPNLAPTGAVWAAGSPNANGVIGGVQVGYNYQFPGTRFVVGVETDFMGAGLNGATTVVGSPVAGTNIFPFIHTYQELNWFGTVRGRVGYAILPTLLIFGTGGFAYGHVSNNYVVGYTNGFLDGAWNSGVRTGWAAGGGLEWAFMPNLSIRAEYLYVDLGHDGTLWDGACGCGGDKGGPVPPPPPVVVPPATFIAAQTGAAHRFHTARVGLNYRFNLFGAPAAAPVLANY
ncbi:outer membrane protein [Methylocystis parvus]|uniref:outer membrane protein n=1 Tax=Methylocystis parvus TaxID=134 RepID=UPI003C71B545